MGGKKVSLIQVLWILTLATWAITTTPLIPFKTAVKPLSFVFVVPVVLLGLPVLSRLVLRRDRFLWVLYFLLFYVLVVGFTTQVLSSRPFDSGLFLQAVMSLLMGFTYYAAFRIMVRDRNLLEQTETWTLRGVYVSLFLAYTQFVVHRLVPAATNLLDNVVYTFIVDTPRRFSTQVHGLALEPSWFASQVAVVALPLVLSHLFRQNKERTNRRAGYFTLMLVVGALFLSGSRTGIVVAGAAFAVTFYTVVTNGKMLKTKLLLGAVLVPVTLIGMQIATTVPYIQRTVDGIRTSTSVIEAVTSVSAGPRVAAWVGAWDTFVDSPVWGVGLGQAPLYFDQFVPPWAMSEVEVQAWLSGDASPNPKNLVVRLLSELGACGTGLYMLFVAGHLKGGRKPSLSYLVLRNAGVIAMVVNWFVLDSFALPTEWFLLGLIYTNAQLESEAE